MFILLNLVICTDLVITHLVEYIITIPFTADFQSQRELLLSEVNNRETIAAIKANNDTYHNLIYVPIEK